MGLYRPGYPVMPSAKVGTLAVVVPPATAVVAGWTGSEEAGAVKPELPVPAKAGSDGNTMPELVGIPGSWA
jgi:hypothetical protein